MIGVVARDRDDIDIGIVEQRRRRIMDAQIGIIAARHLLLGGIEIGGGDDRAIGMAAIAGNVALADAEPDDARAQTRHQAVSSSASASASSIVSSRLRRSARCPAVSMIASMRAKSSAVSIESWSVGRATRATRLRMRNRSGFA